MCRFRLQSDSLAIPAMLCAMLLPRWSRKVVVQPRVGVRVRVLIPPLSVGWWVHTLCLLLRSAQMAREEAAHPHRPQLSTRSAAYVRPSGVSVGDRLHGLAQARSVARARAVQEKEASEYRVDPATGQALGAPHTRWV